MSLGFRDWRAAREVRLMEKAGTRSPSDRTPPRGGAGAGHSASLTAVDPAPAPRRDLGAESWEPAPSPPRGAEGRIGRSSDTIGHAGLEKAPAGEPALWSRGRPGRDQATPLLAHSAPRAAATQLCAARTPARGGRGGSRVPLPSGVRSPSWFINLTLAPFSATVRLAGFLECTEAAPGVWSGKRRIGSWRVRGSCWTWILATHLGARRCARLYYKRDFIESL